MRITENQNTLLIGRNYNAAFFLACLVISSGTLLCGTCQKHNSNATGKIMSKTWHYKLVLLGDTAVGKSCLVVRFVRDEFFEFQEPTIGAAFLTQTVTLDETTVKFEIWDTAGQGE